MSHPHGGVPAQTPGSGYSEIHGIEADIAAMEDFAAALAAEVEKNFGPESIRLTSQLRADFPGAATFRELTWFVEAHEQAKNATYQNVFQFRRGTHGLATAAKKVSDEYRGADAFSSARASDVRDALKNGSQGSNDLPTDHSREVEF